MQAKAVLDNKINGSQFKIFRCDLESTKPGLENKIK